MYYDYRDEFNTLIDLLTDVRVDLRSFRDAFDAFVQLLTEWWGILQSYLPTALWCLVLLIGVNLILNIWFPRWRDV